MPTNPEWQRQGATLRALRHMRGLTAGQLAAQVGKSRSYLCNIEAGRKPIAPLLVPALAEALAVPQIALVAPQRDAA